MRIRALGRISHGGEIYAPLDGNHGESIRGETVDVPDAVAAFLIAEKMAEEADPPKKAEKKAEK